MRRCGSRKASFLSLCFPSLPKCSQALLDQVVKGEVRPNVVENSKEREVIALPTAADLMHAVIVAQSVRMLSNIEARSLPLALPLLLMSFCSQNR